MLFFKLAVRSAPQGRLSLTWEPFQTSILVSLSQTADTLKRRCPYTVPQFPHAVHDPPNLPLPTHPFYLDDALANVSV